MTFQPSISLNMRLSNACTSLTDSLRSDHRITADPGRDLGCLGSPGGLAWGFNHWQCCRRAPAVPNTPQIHSGLSTAINAPTRALSSHPHSIPTPSLPWDNSLSQSHSIHTHTPNYLCFITSKRVSLIKVTFHVWRTPAFKSTARFIRESFDFLQTLTFLSSTSLQLLRDFPMDINFQKKTPVFAEICHKLVEGVNYSHLYDTTQH